MCGQVGGHHAVTDSPARHRVGLGETVQDHGEVRHAIVDGDAPKRPIIEHSRVDLIGQNRYAAGYGDLGDGLQIIFGQNAAGGVLRAVDDDELRPIGDKVLQFVHIQAEVPILPERNGHGFGARELDDGFVDGEPRVGVDDLITGTRKRHNGVEHDRLATGCHNDLIRVEGYAASGRDLLSDGLAQLGQPRGGTIVGEPLGQGLLAGSHDVGRGVKVRFPDFQVDHVFALCLQRPGLYQHFERRFRTQQGHSVGEFHVKLLDLPWLHWSKLREPRMNTDEHG